MTVAEMYESRIASLDENIILIKEMLAMAQNTGANEVEQVYMGKALLQLVNAAFSMRTANNALTKDRKQLIA